MVETAGKLIDTSAAHLEVEPRVTKAEVERGLSGLSAANPLRMPENPIDAFRNGVCLDLRLRFAMELLSQNPNFGPLYDPDGELDPCLTATFALDVSAKLFELGQARGLIEPIPEAATLELVAHAHRQAEMQWAANKKLGQLQEEGSRIAKSVHKAFNQ